MLFVIWVEDLRRRDKWQRQSEWWENEDKNHSEENLCNWSLNGDLKDYDFATDGVLQKVDSKTEFSMEGAK